MFLLYSFWHGTCLDNMGFPIIQALALRARLECLRVIAVPSRDARDLLSI